MARGYSKVQIIGNLGKDPESHTFANGGKVTNVTVAVSESWKDKEGEKQERTEWHQVVFRNGLSDIADEHLKKGTAVFVEGKLRTRKWQDKDGNDRYTTEIHADELRFF